MLRQGVNRYRIRPIGHRAPEVWRGLGCWPFSDIWPLGVMVCCLTLLPAQLMGRLAHWLRPAIFGIRTETYRILVHCQDRLAEGPPVKNAEYDSEFWMAHEMSRGTYLAPGMDGPSMWALCVRISNLSLAGRWTRDFWSSLILCSSWTTPEAQLP